MSSGRKCDGQQSRNVEIKCLVAPIPYPHTSNCIVTMADQFLGFDLSTQQLKGTHMATLLPRWSYPAIEFAR